MSDPSVKEEFELRDVDGAFLIGPDAPGAYIVSNVDGDKVIHEIQVGAASDLLNGGQVATITRSELAKLDASTTSQIVALHLDAEAQYGITIASNGYVEIFEYHASKEDWEERIGPADSAVVDTMVYARTSEFYKDPDNRI